MVSLRKTALTLCLLLATATIASPWRHASDSLQTALAQTTDPVKRVSLLFDLRDLNEDSDLQLPYSIQLFREAAAINDTYAMSVAAIPIIKRYSAYIEKNDSLHYYVRTLRKLTPGTTEEGIDEFSEAAIAFNQLNDEYNPQRKLEIARDIIHWCDSLDGHPSNIYRQVKILLCRGFAKSQLDYFERGNQTSYIAQTASWKEAYELTRRMPDINIRRHFANLIYEPLSTAYNQAGNYADLVTLTDDYIRTLDDYYSDSRITDRRPYLYADNSYAFPYQQLMRGSLNIGRKDLSEEHFRDFRRRMLGAQGKNLTRNKSHLYEMGYLWKGVDGEYEQSISYCDSLIQLIENKDSDLRIEDNKLRLIYSDHARLLYFAGYLDQSYDAFERACTIQDSLFAAERNQRAATIRHNHEMDRMKLSETRTMIRNRIATSASFVAIVVVVLATGVYLYRALRRNRRLQADILRHNRKAQESEHMKSTFINTICRGIQPPLELIDSSVHELMFAEPGSPERQPLHTTIRDNTIILLSTLDNMLEASNLDSLSERLTFEQTNIDEICRAELLAASRLCHTPDVNYTIQSPASPCIVPTHAKYFTFVVRALLDNAGKFTHTGEISLGYAVLKGRLQVTVTDTGCGIPPEKRGEIFRPFCPHSPATHGLSLSLCCLIAEHLSGTIRLDDEYTGGARFIFTIPART